MRGRFKEQASLEEPRRAGAEGELPRRGKRSWPGPCPRRLVLQGFALRGEFLFHVEKEPKDARGSAQDGHFVSIFAAAPRTPITGDAYLGICQRFPARKI